MKAADAAAVGAAGKSNDAAELVLVRIPGQQIYGWR